MHRTAVATALAAVFLATGCGEEPVSKVSTPEQAAAAIEDAPPALASLYAQPSEVLDGGLDAFKRRLDALKGHPVVVNKWASWCPPCRFEFPFFQELSEKYGAEVAFLGLDSGDNRDDAEGFLDDFPTAYPHYEDPDEEIARDIGASTGYPITVFYDDSGEKVFMHQGGYAKAEQLEADIERHALGRAG